MIYLLITVFIILADIISKRLALTNLAQIDTVPVWDGVFHLTYVENRGAAFGIMQNQRWFFIVLTVIVLAVIVYVCLKNRFSRPLMCTALSLMAGGAIGNLIDRIFYGYVVDFLDFRLIDFPVFNVADIFVVSGACLLAVYIIFFDQDNKEETKKDENNNC